ncbi:MAG: tetratricopeptide repeat protein [Parcubacteria group bacterium]|nr:tetratricopeptide repeat protein [Parcubacteria group bacterium]
MTDTGALPQKNFFSFLKKIKNASLDVVSMGIVFWGIVLLPLFFFPVLGFSIDTSKILFLIAFILLSFLLWLFARLKEGSITIPLHPTLAAAAIVVLIFIISALFSPTPQSSFFGFTYEIGTVVFMTVLFLLFFLVSLFFQSSRSVELLYQSLLVVFGISFLFWVLRLLLGVDFLSFGGFFPGKASTIIGKWNDFAVFAGFIALLSLITLEKVSLHKRIRAALYSVLFLSLFVLAIVNFYLVWIIVGLFALIIFVYNFSSNRFAKNTKDSTFSQNVSYPSGIVLVVALLFVIAGGTIGGFLNETLGITQIEVRPSWASTGIILKETIKEHPLLGSGPNRFTNQWFTFKPGSINSSPFWNTEFRSGVGLLPTFAVTTGVLGAVSLSIFLFLFLYQGARSLFATTIHRLEYVVFSSFVLALYLWVIAFFYVPNVVLFTLAFAITGVFVGALVGAGKIKQYTFSYFENPRAGFISVLVLSILLIGTVTMGYAVTKKIIALKNFYQSRTAFTVGDLETAEGKIKKAINQNTTDVYYRGLAEIKTRQITALLSRNDVSPEDARAQFQSLLGEAIFAGQQAVQFDKTQYVNWLALARVYESVVPLVTGAYESARVSLAESLSRYPQSPLLTLEHARLEIANRNINEARRYIGEALQMKPDYANAIFLLAQIEFSEGNISAAIRSVEGATLAAPNDEGLFFQLGLLKFNTRDYKGSAEALVRAVELNPQFANAKYFLGLSFYNINRTAEAIVQFEGIELANPENQEVKQILENLRNGNGPFANFNEPDFSERDTLPLNE